MTAIFYLNTSSVEGHLRAYRPVDYDTSAATATATSTATSTDKPEYIDIAPDLGTLVLFRR